ncbi:MAG: hypothetical protein ACKVK0_03120, partial [Pirellulales bacterium]
MRRKLIIFGAMIFVASLFVALGTAEDTGGNPAAEVVTQPVVQATDQLDTPSTDAFVLSVPVGSGALEAATAAVVAPINTTSVLVV